MAHDRSFAGVGIALTLILVWSLSIVMLMQWDFSWSNPFVYLAILVQMHLYTGLFITAHDAIHGTVSSRKWLNQAIGQICVALYAAFSFGRVYNKHHQHHQHVHTDSDPDYHQGGFWHWYIKFMRTYLSIWQIIIMALLFNILKYIGVSELNMILFWVLPSILSTLQLFYFGTYLPHHGEQPNKHRSGTQKKGHFFAFISCYFFGYHYEHHEAPAIPWWRLWKLKN